MVTMREMFDKNPKSIINKPFEFRSVIDKHNFLWISNTKSGLNVLYNEFEYVGVVSYRAVQTPGLIGKTWLTYCLYNKNRRISAKNKPTHQTLLDMVSSSPFLDKMFLCKPSVKGFQPGSFYVIRADSKTKSTLVPNTTTTIPQGNMSNKQIQKANETSSACVKCGSKLTDKLLLNSFIKFCESCQI